MDDISGLQTTRRWWRRTSFVVDFDTKVEGQNEGVGGDKWLSAKENGYFKPVWDDWWFVLMNRTVLRGQPDLPEQRIKDAGQFAAAPSGPPGHATTPSPRERDGKLKVIETNG